MTPSILKLVRKIHLYMGVFTAPALLFFALTGALQTFSLHETTRGSDYKPPAWAVTLGQLHKKQTIELPPRRSSSPPSSDKGASNKAKVAPPAATVKAPAATAASTTPTTPTTPKTPAPPAPPAPKEHSHLPMKIFFLLVAIGLVVSTLTGVTMAYKYNRSKVVVTSLLLAGIIIPLLLLRF